MTGGDGFDLLADETRAAILRALADARREDPVDPALSFSELRRRVGATDSGRFNYHLGKLRGHFVTEADGGGYRLSAVGVRAAGSVLGGEFDDPPERDPVELDDHCGRCGDPLAASYERGRLTVSCGNGHGFADAVPPAAVEEHGLEGAVDAFDAKLRGDVALARRGACPLCHGEMTWSLERDLPDEAPIDFFYLPACGRCGHNLGVPPGMLVLDHPALVAAYRDAGVDVRERPFWTLDCSVPGAADLAAEDPVRVAVDAGPDGDLEFVLDDSANVVDAPEP
ncbi:winged helix-turn-helix domain-containing protein [Halobacterium yunchengense]|uniref:winged helix-turn-helix domain-containing protein n=1 Tax=Halobacterium yunchengense TaxID=3108497 RepID=UPI003009F01A